MAIRYRTILRALPSTCLLSTAIAACSSGDPGGQASRARELGTTSSESLSLVCYAYFTNIYYDQLLLALEGLEAISVLNNYGDCIAAFNAGNDGLQVFRAGGITTDESTCACTAVFGSANAPHWIDNDLTGFTHTAIAATNTPMDSYWGLDASQHINFIDVDGDVHELFYNQDVGGTSWVDNNLTILAKAVSPRAGSPIDGYWETGDSAQHVNFISPDGHVHELFIHPGAGWVDNDLFNMAITGRTLAASTSSLDGYPEASDNSQHVNFIDANQHVHELFFTPALGWFDNDLTHNSNGTPAAAGSPLDGYWDPTDNSQHVNFIASNGHVHELFFNNLVWQDNDLTNNSRGIAATAGSKLDGYWESTDQSQHINFIGTDGHVHELFFPPGGPWNDNDLTRNSGGAVPAAGSSLNGYTEADDFSQHVNFFDANGHVHELLFHPGNGWSDNDLFQKATNGTAAVAGSAIRGYWEAATHTQHVQFVDPKGHVQELFY